MAARKSSTTPKLSDAILAKLKGEYAEFRRELGVECTWEAFRNLVVSVSLTARSITESLSWTFS
jgi:hypothetical protein